MFYSSLALLVSFTLNKLRKKAQKTGNAPVSIMRRKLIIIIIK